MIKRVGSCCFKPSIQKGYFYGTILVIAGLALAGSQIYLHHLSTFDKFNAYFVAHPQFLVPVTICLSLGGTLISLSLVVSLSQVLVPRRKITIIDSSTRKEFYETVKGKFFINFLYPNQNCTIYSFFPKLIFMSNSVLSRFLGWFYSKPCSKSTTDAFKKTFTEGPDKYLPEDFEDKEHETFNSFFTRQLKNPATLNGALPPGASPGLIAPATARYTFIENLEDDALLTVKGKRFSLSQLLKNKELAKTYAQGTMIIARLAPQDYHRFHFPASGTASKPTLINGWYHSVNPWAVRKNFYRFAENKRVITYITTKNGVYGEEFVMLEVGAFGVGSIVQTYNPSNDPKEVKLGDEKGLFKFGGSTIILLFKKNAIKLRQDLVAMQEGHNYEVYCKVGTPLVAPEI